MAFTVCDTAQGAQFALRVQPRARGNRFAGVVGDAIKLAITAPPVDGKANAAVIDYLAGWFQVPKSNIVIVSGATGRNKRIAVRGMRAEHVRQALGL